MYTRPKVGETEEDLLKQEEEFLRQTGKEATRKRTHELEQASEAKKITATVRDVIGDIVEKKHNHIIDPKIVNVERGNGFPVIFQIDPNVVATDRKGKKSLFALHMEKKSKAVVSSDVDMEGNSGEVENVVQRDESCSKNTEAPVMQCGSNGGGDPPPHSDVSSMKESVHKESMTKLSRMTEQEILEAQRKLYETLDPKLIELLKNRSKAKQKVKPLSKVGTLSEDVEMKEVDNTDEELKEKLSSYVGEKWINLDFMEKEKLEWVGDIPDAKALEPNQPYSARFNFKGELQPFTTEEIDVRNSLHHHGDEPERPGYTIQELYQLSRSTVLQQRILALNTLANIIRKTKLGYYDVCFDGFLLHKLLESDLFLLLRFSIDENALIPSTIHCLRRLLYNDTDEYCLDKLLGIMRDDDPQPLLYDKMEMNPDEEKELKDNTIINCDVIKGVLRTDLIVRISYALNNLSCDRETITNAILCFIRISRHSVESSKQILCKSDLLNFVYSRINCDKPIYEGVKLFRLLVGQSREAASEVLAKYPMNFVIDYVNADRMTEVSKGKFYLLKLESVYLWRNFLRYNMMMDELRSWTPCFVRLLRFYIEKVDMSDRGDFDFELFTALVSILRLLVRKKHTLESDYIATMYVIMEKWLKQLLLGEKFCFAGLKALGSCLAFFVDYFETFGVDGTGLRFIQQFNADVATLFASNVFRTMTVNLVNHSHILEAGVIKRDPKNLPSLCSVYEEGADFLQIVNNKSTIAFFIPLAKYLRMCYSVTRDSGHVVEAFVRCPDLRSYVDRVVKLKNKLENWFAVYETTFLTDVLHLFAIFGDGETFRLGFRLLPMLRVDDDNVKSVLSVVTNKNIWMTADDCFDHLLEIYSEFLYKPGDVDGGLRYKNDLVKQDWMYSVLTDFRGKEAVAEVVKVLRFISFVTTHRNEVLSRVPYNLRYYHLSTVFLTDSNVFDDDVQAEMKKNFRCILDNRDSVLLERNVSSNKSFYDLYTELITQYAGVSYGLHIFAELVLFPLRNRFDVSFRKLLWFEYLHVLRVITLPYPTEGFLDLDDFTEPCETDESLLVAYLNSVANGVILKNRNPFVYHIAVGNVKRFLSSSDGRGDGKLATFLRQRIAGLKNERVRRDVTE